MRTTSSGLDEEIFLQSYGKLIAKEMLESNDIFFYDMREWDLYNLQRDRKWLLENRIRTEELTYNLRVPFNL